MPADLDDIGIGGGEFRLADERPGARFVAVAPVESCGVVQIRQKGDLAGFGAGLELRLRRRL